ncbi:DUF1298 domain-containing protein [archaeon]|nr:MAG: DUF1298 domain-containing protein [archaeon]
MMADAFTTWYNSVFTLSRANGQGSKLGTLSVFAAALAIFAIGTWLKARKLHKKMLKGRVRSVSFSSQQMLSGIFPGKSKVRQPIINAVFYFKKCPDADKMVKVCESLMVFDRMRSGVTLINGVPHLVEIPDVPRAAKESVISRTVNGESELRNAIDEINAEEFEYGEAKPLLTLYRLENTGTGRSAVLGRAHHVLGDGFALVGLMNRLFSDKEGNPLKIDLAENKKPIGGKNLRFGLSMIPRLIRGVIDVLLLPNSAYDTDIKFFARHNQSVSMGERKSVDFPAIKLDFIKDLKNKANVTVNDVLFAATSGMLRAYSVKHDDPAFKKSVQTRALMPIAFPRKREDMKDPAKALRNLWSLVSAPMCVNETSPLARLRACAKVTKRLKLQPNALIQLFFQDNAVSHFPTFLQRQIALDVFSRHTMVFSNVPGPPTTVYYCGEEVVSMSITFPNIIPQVIVISYNGGIFFNLNIDPTEANVDDLSQLFVQELKKMGEELGCDVSDEAVYFKSH